MKPLAQNTLIQGRYLVVHLIGKGGMGEVYLAIDQRLGHPVALKRTIFTDDDAMGVAFEREARTLARLRHPALPKVSDHFSENENQFLVMEHISGDDLGKRISAMKKPFPMSWVLFWADQLLEALNYLHSNEPAIIHRDIKPQNLKLTEDNNIILLDFGLSKSGIGQPAGQDSGSGSGSGSIIGYTPHFAPMEQIRGTGTNPRSDIYSLCATLYQLLTNVCPADALTRADAMLSGGTDPLRPLYELNPEIPKSISDVIIKGMAVTQDQRHASAREMQKILRDAYSRLQGEMGAQTVMMDASAMGDLVPSGNDVAAPPDIAAPPMEDSIETAARQADLKTEIFAAPVIEPQVSNPVPETPEPGPAFAQEADAVEEAYSPEATAPAIEIDLSPGDSVAGIPASPYSDAPPSPYSETPESSFGEGPAGSGSDGSATPFEEAPKAAEPVVYNPTPSVAPAAAGKKSKGALIGVLVVIVLIGLLLVGGLVGAYFFLGRGTVSVETVDDNSALETPSPTRVPTPSPEPSVEPSPEASNQNTSMPTPQASPSPTPFRSSTPEASETPRPQPTQRPTPRPQPTQRPTPRPQPTASRPPRQIPQ